MFVLDFGRHVGQLRRRRRRCAYAPTNNTASYDNHEKINSWVSTSFARCLWSSAWRPLGPPELRYNGKQLRKASKQKLSNFVVLDHTYIMQRNTAKNNLLITQTGMHTYKFSYLAESFYGREVVFNSLENEPASVSHQGVYTTVETNKLAQM